MAMMLKRRHGLVSLKVMLEAGGAEPRVRLAVELAENHVLRTGAEWSYSPSELGIPARLDREQARGGGIPLRYPGAMMEDLSYLLEHGIETPALWLHLLEEFIKNLGPDAPPSLIQELRALQQGGSSTTSMGGD